MKINLEWFGITSDVCRIVDPLLERKEKKKKEEKGSSKSNLTDIREM